jgi:hypothetical protein
MTELRSRTRQEEGNTGDKASWGQSSRNTDATTQEAKRKRKEAGARPNLYGPACC